MESSERWTYVEAVDVWIAAVEEQEAAMQELREQGVFAECFALLDDEPGGG
jgi:hypothetical protein